MTVAAAALQELAKHFETCHISELLSLHPPLVLLRVAAEALQELSTQRCLHGHAHEHLGHSVIGLLPAGVQQLPLSTCRSSSRREQPRCQLLLAAACKGPGASTQLIYSSRVLPPAGTAQWSSLSAAEQLYLTMNSCSASPLSGARLCPDPLPAQAGRQHASLNAQLCQGSWLQREGYTQGMASMYTVQ